jgi:biotin carboxyl carrier protein
MKVKVKIDGEFFDVEIRSLSERPIIAVVNGEEFEVWPETNTGYSTSISHPKKQNEAQSPSMVLTPAAVKMRETSSAIPADGTIDSKVGPLKFVTAPIPGVITAILVQAGSTVVVGQELCKLEAMKMNNSIRASRAGNIRSVKVSLGQHVKHNDVLLEYSE